MLRTRRVGILPAAQLLPATPQSLLPLRLEDRTGQVCAARMADRSGHVEGWWLGRPGHDSPTNR